MRTPQRDNPIKTCLIERRKNAQTDVAASTECDRTGYGLGEGDNGVAARIFLEICGRPIGTRHFGTGEHRLGLQMDFRNWRRITGLHERLEYKAIRLAPAAVVAAGQHERRH